LEEEKDDGLVKLVKHGAQSRADGIEREKKGERPELKEEFKEQVDSLDRIGQQVLLAMTLESLRGSWSYWEDRLALVHYLCDVLEKTGVSTKKYRVSLPKDMIKAIRHNAYLFDGEWIDGRIFRDGSRSSGLTGDISYYLTGDDREAPHGFEGTYFEVWMFAAYNCGGDNLLYRMKVVYKILGELDDLTFEDLAEE